MLPACQENTVSPEQEIWKPPKAPDQITDAPIEYLNRAVLRIKSTWNDLDEVIHQESGAGIALGMKRGKLYIMTAAHVVRSKIHGSADNIKVILKRSPRENYSAELVDCDPERDFAVLITQRIGNEQDWDSVVKFAVEYEYTYSPGRNVKVIGHPKNYLWQEITTKTVTSNNLSLMRLERSSIDYGNSGGPVLSESHRLIGMVTAVKGDEAEALKITEIVKILERWGITYRTRFAADFSNNFEILIATVYNRNEESLYGKLYEEKYFAKLFRPRVALFNPDLALFVEEKGKIDNRTYYVELVGYYYSENKYALDEAWRILVHNISKFIPAGYEVREEGYNIDFSKFEFFKGRMHIRIVERVGTLFVVIGKNMDENIITLGESISDLDYKVLDVLGDKRREIEQR